MNLEVRFADAVVDAAEHTQTEALLRLAASDPRAYCHRYPSGLQLMFSGCPLASTNGVFNSRRTTDLAEVTLVAAEAARLFRTHPDVPWSIRLRSAPEPEIISLAAEYGLTQVSESPLMVRELTGPGSPAPEPTAPVIRTLTGSDLDIFVATMTEGFETPETLFAQTFSSPMMDTPGVTMYLAELDGVPVATGNGVLVGDHIYLCNISTIPAYRKRGYGRLMTEHIIRQGYRNGARTAVLQASEAGVPLYLSMGFGVAESWTYLTA